MAESTFTNQMLASYLERSLVGFQSRSQLGGVCSIFLRIGAPVSFSSKSLFPASAFPSISFGFRSIIKKSNTLGGHRNPPLRITRFKCEAAAADVDADDETNLLWQTFFSQVEVRIDEKSRARAFWNEPLPKFMAFGSICCRHRRELVGARPAF